VFDPQTYFSGVSAVAEKLFHAALICNKASEFQIRGMHISDGWTDFFARERLLMGSCIFLKNNSVPSLIFHG